MARAPIDELDELARRSIPSIEKSLARFARDMLRGINDETGLAKFRRELGEMMTLADLLGRRRLMLESRAVQFEDAATGFPETVFTQAIQDLVKREPIFAAPLSVSGEPMWQTVARIYQDQYAFSVSRAANESVVSRVQGLITEMTAGAITLKDAETKLVGEQGWTRAYAETVYRTNLNTAFTAGRFKQAEHPAVAQAIGAFEYQAIGDADVRASHAAADGLVASQFDPIWDTFAPPLGYNCRCAVRMVSRPELKRRGLIEEGSGRVLTKTPPRFDQAAPDPGFGNRRRPDREIYNG